MKIKLLLVSIVLLAFACQNTPKETSEQENTETTTEVSMVNVQKIELNISGMTCTGCESAVQEAIDAFDGVYSSKADHTKGVAILELDSIKINIADLKLAINDLGYEATEHNVVAK